MSLSDPVTVLKGVGASRAAQLERLNIRTLEELIHSYPRDYEDRSKLVSLSQLTVAQPACFRAMEPTSPCTSRFMGFPEERSSEISFRARCCAPVREKGSWS